MSSKNANVCLMMNLALHFAICGEVYASLNRMSENVLSTVKAHKEESAKIISAD